MLSGMSEQHKDSSGYAGHSIDVLSAGSSANSEPLHPNSDDNVSRSGDVVNDKGHRINEPDQQEVNSVIVLAEPRLKNQ